jgi:hypothetical protein
VCACVRTDTAKWRKRKRGGKEGGEGVYSDNESEGKSRCFTKRASRAIACVCVCEHQATHFWSSQTEEVVGNGENCLRSGSHTYSALPRILRGTNPKKRHLFRRLIRYTAVEQTETKVRDSFPLSPTLFFFYGDVMSHPASRKAEHVTEAERGRSKNRASMPTQNCLAPY